MNHEADTCIRCGTALKGNVRCNACGAERPDDPYVGRTIGNRYQLHELLGIGGMGRVYRATHLALDRQVAIKLINPKHLDNQAAAARFLVEARAISRLNHPNVVAIHDFGGGSAAEGPELYLVMELLGGTSLGTLLHDGPMPIARATEILCQILAGLHEAHKQGVIHRDIKPENVVIEPVRPGVDRVKVIDFGVAKLEASAQLTRFGEVVGTPRYMAPEQAGGKPASPSTDIYAVGVLMFEMLTGRRLFEGKGTLEVLAQILSTARPDPRAVAPERGIPAPLAQLCMRAIAHDVEARPASAEAFARALVEALGTPWSAKHSMLFVAPVPASRPSSDPATPRLTKPDDATTEVKAPRRRHAFTPTFTPAMKPPSTPGMKPPSTPGMKPPSAPPEMRISSAPPSLRQRLTVPMKSAAPRAGEQPSIRPISSGVEDSTIRRLAAEHQTALQGFLGGEHDADHALLPIGRKLGSALAAAGRVDEAYGVLSEVLEHAAQGTRDRALVSEELADVAARRGRIEEAKLLRQRALTIAEALGDQSLAGRLRDMIDWRSSGVRVGATKEARQAARRKTGGGHRDR